MNRQELEDRCKKIRAVVSDVDGVLTDGGMYYGEHGDELKKFNVRDGVGVAILQASGIAAGIITGESTELVVRRMKKMGMQFAFTGIKNKKAALADFLSKHGLKQEEVAYIGDEINDFCLLGQVGVFFAPNDACNALKEKADYVLITPGGQGVLREVAELLLAAKGEYDSALENYINNSISTPSKIQKPAGYDDVPKRTVLDT